MPSQIQLNRQKQYKKLADENKSVRVYARAPYKEIGFIVGDGPDYWGEAGYSTRVWVLWASGKRTLCTTQGMKPYRKKHWRIR